MYTRIQLPDEGFLWVFIPNSVASLGGQAITGYLNANGFAGFTSFSAPQVDAPTGVAPASIADPSGALGGAGAGGDGAGGDGAGGGGAGTRGEASEEERREAFQRGLATQFPDLAQLQGTTAGRFLERQFDPYQTAFLGRQFARGLSTLDDPASAAAPGAFEQFVGQTPVGSLGGLPGSTFNQLAGLASQRLASRGDEAALNPNFQGLIAPETPGAARILQDLARGAFTNRFGEFLGGILAPQRVGSADLLGRFNAQRDTGQFAFTDFLRRRFGLGSGA